MNEILQPWQLLLAILSSWIHHRQQKMIEFQNDPSTGRPLRAWIVPEGGSAAGPEWAGRAAFAHRRVGLSDRRR